MFRGYLRLVVFAVGLLVGVQVPGFIDQYSKRVNAHYLEAEKNFSFFQQTADRYFEGNIASLIDHYDASEDPVFQDDAESVQGIFSRVKMLSAEAAAMSQQWYKRAAHVLLSPNQELLEETFSEYSYTVPLAPEAIAWGVSVGLSVALLLEALLLALAGSMRFGVARCVHRAG
jgi:hypothetical protein